MIPEKGNRLGRWLLIVLPVVTTVGAVMTALGGWVGTKAFVLDAVGIVAPMIPHPVPGEAAPEEIVAQAKPVPPAEQPKHVAPEAANPKQAPPAEPGAQPPAPVHEDEPVLLVRSPREREKVGETTAFEGTVKWPENRIVQKDLYVDLYIATGSEPPKQRTAMALVNKENGYTWHFKSIKIGSSATIPETVFEVWAELRYADGGDSVICKTCRIQISR